MKKTVYFFAFLLLFLVSISTSTKAHPHSWIDLETALIFDDEGRVTGLWVGWLFDDYYSAFTLEGIKPDNNGRYDQKLINELAETNLKNLSEYNYFTFMRSNETDLKYKPVSTYKTSVENHRLWMEFTVELKAPIDPRKEKFDYAVYDPTYYVEILHAENGDPIQMTGTHSLGCNYQIKAPEPPEEISLLAAALDQDETAGNSIGISFAESVIILCD